MTHEAVRGGLPPWIIPCMLTLLHDRLTVKECAKVMIWIRHHDDYILDDASSVYVPCHSVGDILHTQFRRHQVTKDNCDGNYRHLITLLIL